MSGRVRCFSPSVWNNEGCLLQVITPIEEVLSVRRREEQKRRWLEELDKQREETTERRRREKQLQSQVPSDPVVKQCRQQSCFWWPFSCVFSRRTTSSGPRTSTPCRESLPSPPQLPLPPHYKALSRVSGSPRPGCLSSRRPWARAEGRVSEAPLWIQPVGTPEPGTGES